MTNAEKFLYALAMTESLNDDKAWGDYDKSPHLGGSPRAFGRWQVHIDRLFDEAKRYKLYPFAGETVDHFGGRVVTAMYEHRTEEKYDALAIAQYWHLGHFAQAVSYDQEYSRRFNSYWNREMAAEKPVDDEHIIGMLSDVIAHLQRKNSFEPSR